MASAEEILSLRLLIGQPDNVEPYTDQVLSDRIDAAEGDLDEVAYIIWTEKAASYSGLVDMAESGSSRSLSQLHKNALSMAARFRSTEGTEEGPSGTLVHKLTR